jgi:hypothetical protein
MSVVRTLPLLVMLVAATAAQAGGNVCLVDTANDAVFVLTKPRVPKQLGAGVPVAGYGETATGSSLPISGTLLHTPDGNLYLGLTRYFQRCLVSITLQEELAGTGSVAYDCNLDGANDGSSASIDVVDCDTLLQIL